MTLLRVVDCGLKSGRHPSDEERPPESTRAESRNSLTANRRARILVPHIAPPDPRSAAMPSPGPPARSSSWLCGRRSRTGRASPRPHAGRREGRSRDDSRAVRLRPSGGPGRGAADPRGARGRGEDPVRRLQPDPAAEAAARAAGRCSSTSGTSPASTASSRPTTSSASAPARPIARSTRTRSSSTATRSSHDVAGGIGDPQVRNWGTIGGSVAHADPASDWPAVLLAAHADDRLPRR